MFETRHVYVPSSDDVIAWVKASEKSGDRLNILLSIPGPVASPSYQVTKASPPSVETNKRQKLKHNNTKSVSCNIQDMHEVRSRQYQVITRFRNVFIIVRFRVTEYYSHAMLSRRKKKQIVYFFPSYYWWF